MASTIKKRAFVLSLIFLFLWFGINGGLYLYMKKYIHSNKVDNRINLAPKKIDLTSHDVLGDSYCLMGLNFRMPSYYERISFSSVSFVAHKISLIGLSIENRDNKKQTIYFCRPSVDKNKVGARQSDSLISKIIFGRVPFMQLKALIYNSKFEDYSWWNLPANIRLSYLLVIKVSALSVDDSIYEVKTAHLNGFLREKLMDRRTRRQINNSFEFELNGEYFELWMDDSGSILHSADLAVLLSSIKKADDPEKCNKESKEPYKKESQKKYPEELLLLSAISTGNTTLDNMRRLLNLVEHKETFDPDTLQELKEEIKYLSQFSHN